jgi:hypothetical protein
MNRNEHSMILLIVYNEIGALQASDGCYAKHHIRCFINAMVPPLLVCLSLFRVLEVNGHQVINLSELQLYKQLSSISGNAKMVVLRLPDSKQRHCSDDLESLKEDLALALMELEAVQQENKELAHEVDM